MKKKINKNKKKFEYITYFYHIIEIRKEYI